MSFSLDYNTLNGTPKPDLPTPIVAKLYDPLYYDHSDDYVDPFLFVDVEYTWDNVAYRYLRGQGQKCIPEYYGSYSMDISHLDNQFRTVRLILLEWVKGHPMVDIHPTEFPDDVWKAVMKQIVDVESQLYKVSLRHGDTHPRNVIIECDKIETSEPCVRFIDFGHAVIGRSPNPQDNDQEMESLPGVYISPLLRWFKARGREPVCSFEDWINWDWNEWLVGTDLSDKENMTPEMIRKWLPDDMYQKLQSLIELR